MRSRVGELLAILNLALSAYNVGAFVATGDPFAVGAAVFNGGVFLYLLWVLRDA